ncbi:MAG: outer membrane lipoprotein carrier protein LolA [Spirochaetaceae bacterium]|nr:outer membrane lipoprotein carrier protein LolA [Spirochaetaceae bacterium]
MKKLFLLILICISLSCVFAQNQTILTAGNFFKSVSEYYATIKDYEASFKITAGSEMSGKVSFKAPNLLRMDFDDPEKQVIVFDGERLQMYLPLSNATLIQEVDKDASTTSAADAGNLATPQGLYLMNRYYFIAYENGQDPEPLEEGSSENVVKLILTRKTVAEGFTTINLAVNPDTKLIRRIRAVTPNDEVFEFSFTQYILNTNIPDVRFVYDSPSDANNYYNFLYTE